MNSMRTAKLTRYRLSALGFIAIMGGVSGFQMLGLIHEGQSPARWTLGIYLAVWMAFLVIRTRNWNGDDPGWRWLGLSSLSGLALFLGFPPLPFTPLLFVALVPLMVVQREIEKSAISQNGNQSGLFFFLFNAFVLWNVLSTYWVANAQWAAGVFANTANALLMCLPFLLWHQTRKVMTGSITRIALVSFWLSFEYLHHRWELAWPWLSFGNALGEWPALAQWYAYTGVGGGTLWILMTNIFIFRLVRHYYYGISIKKRAVTKALVLWVAIPASLSLFLFLKPSDTSKAVEVVLVQPAINPYTGSAGTGDDSRISPLLALAEPLLTDSTKLLVFPEAALGMSFKNQLGQNGETGKLAEWLRNRPGLRIITGLTLVEWFELSDELPPFVRLKDSKDGPDRYYAVYNAAAELHSMVGDIAYSCKSKLVPGAESFPYKNYLHVLHPLLDLFGAGGTGFGYQEERIVFEADPGIPVSPLICYESAFGEFTTGFVKNGAEALVIVTNDSWWGNTAGHQQHLRLASLRAIETGRAIGRCANGGISAFISDKGVIQESSPYGEATALRGMLPLHSKMTFYTKNGDLIGRIAFFAGLLLAVNVLVKRLLPKEKVNRPE